MRLSPRKELAALVLYWENIEGASKDLLADLKRSFKQGRRARFKIRRSFRGAGGFVHVLWRKVQPVFCIRIALGYV